jgi:hypothetical protein
MFIQNSYRFGTVAAGLLLDTYTGAAAAYSLRKLKTGITNVVRVRRSSDNTEQNFTPTEITNGTLTTFTGANDGFVTIWYDQSGNSNNAVQVTATQQPKIVENGVIVLENGKAGIKGESTRSTNLKSGSYSQGAISQPISAFIAGSPSFGNDSIFDTDGGSDFFLAGTLVNAGSTLLLNTFPNQTQYLLFQLFNNTNSNYYVNGTLENSGLVGSNDMEGITLFNKSSPTINNGQNGILQEVIIYSLNQTSNKIGIEANINTEYTIY